MLELWNIMGGPVTVADASADGTMPTRAFRYCEAMRLAAGAGYAVQAPDDFDLMWDGEQIMHRQFHDGAPLPWNAVQPNIWLPGWDDGWNQHAPEELHGQAPPTLTALREPGLVQIALGIAVRLPADWRLWVRPPANLARLAGFEFFEGVMECATARHVFINARLTKTDVPLAIRVGAPLVQMVPVPLSTFTTPRVSIDALNGREDEPIPWNELMGAMQVEPNDKPPGTYAAAERKAMKGTPT